MTSYEVWALLQDVESRTGDTPTEYTQGYKDALRYIAEALEEEE